MKGKRGEILTVVHCELSSLCEATEDYKAIVICHDTANKIHMLNQSLSFGPPKLHSLMTYNICGNQ